MIKFFRHIRKSLIEENQMGKYFKYAIGEILLVMIGILAALQVNNWNEERKQGLEEVKLLQEIRKDVAFGVDELKLVADENAKTVKYLSIIQKHLNEDLPYAKVLDTAFGYLDIFHIPYVPRTSYETLKVKGSDRIKNDSLKAKIVFIFDFGLQRLNDYSDWEWSFSQNTSQRMMIGNIRRTDKIDDGNASPNNYEALKKNVEFGNFLNVLLQIRADHVNALNIGSSQMQELLDMLDKELEPHNHD